MRAKIGLAVAAFALATIGIAPTVTAQADPDFYWVCHVRGNGEHVLLVTGLTGALNHRDNHGDQIYERVWPFVPPPCE